MDMCYYRKIFASWLHKHGVSDVLIDLLQGSAFSSTENNTNERITESPRRDLNARPKVYETFALPAELLGLGDDLRLSHIIYHQLRRAQVS